MMAQAHGRGGKETSSNDARWKWGDEANAQCGQLVDLLPPARKRAAHLARWGQTWPLACGGPSLQEDQVSHHAELRSGHMSYSVP